MSKIPSESKNVIISALTNIRHELNRLKCAGVTLGGMTEDHKLVMIETLWADLGLVGAVELDDETDEWIITHQPVEDPFEPLPVQDPEFIVHSWCLADGDTDNCTGNLCGEQGGRRTTRIEAIECPKCFEMRKSSR